MRIGRRLLVTALVLGGLFIGANIVAERFAEGRLADAAKAELKTTAKPVVDLDFPVLLDVMKGRLQRLVLDATDARLEDLSVSNVHIVLEGVLDPFNAISNRTPLRVETGAISVLVEQKAVNDLLARRREQARVELRENLVVVTARAGTCPVRAEGLPKLEKGNLVFRPSKTPTTTCPTSGSKAEREALTEAATFSIELPKLPGGVAIGRVEVHAGRLALVAVVNEAVIDLG